MCPHQLLVYIDEVNLLRENINIIKRNTGTLDALEKVGIEVKSQKTKYMLMSRHQTAGQTHNRL
jgi:hypothetical protein